MVRFEITVFCFCLAVILSGVTVSGLLFNGPCDVRPRYKGGIPKNPDFSTEVQVLASCRTGTFRWHHPRGHAMVKFNNTQRTLTSICVRDSLDGNIFTIIDTNTKAVVGPFVNDRWACTARTNKTEIILRVNAPKEKRYVAIFKYKLVR